MNLEDKIVLAHRGYFNKESRKEYKENSRDVCRVSGTKEHIDIIEIDVRKSKDGVLWCYHGKFFQYHFSLRKPLYFSEIKEKYNANTLEEVFEVIPEDKILYLDIKDATVTINDILKILKGKKFKEIIIGKISVSTAFLDKFTDLPEGFVKIMNGNIFAPFYNLEKLKAKKYKYFEVVFPFQVRKELVKKVFDCGLEFKCCDLFFLSKENYWDVINKYGIKHISSNFI